LINPFFLFARGVAAWIPLLHHFVRKAT